MRAIETNNAMTRIRSDRFYISRELLSGARQWCGHPVIPLKQFRWTGFLSEPAMVLPINQTSVSGSGSPPLSGHGFHSDLWKAIGFISLQIRLRGRETGKRSGIAEEFNPPSSEKRRRRIFLYALRFTSCLHTDHVTLLFRALRKQ